VTIANIEHTASDSHRMITMVNRLTLVLSQANRFLSFSRVILNHETDFFVIVERIKCRRQP
jgi:hypothetical protein